MRPRDVVLLWPLTEEPRQLERFRKTVVPLLNPG